MEGLATPRGSPKIVQLLRYMHPDTHYVVQAPGLGLGDSFPVETGSNQ